MCSASKFAAPKTVQVRKGFKSFEKNINVLSNINLTVEQGTVYGLLGASGCGKTTLLSCILSIQHLDSGCIRIFGKVPGTKKCGIPGPLVGYMPQETALYYLFSIHEAIWYFGKLYGMTNREIDDRIRSLKNILQLPKLSRIIDTLSGGQSRRVSLALALIHKPKLLILDEPSVGLDPVLRESIWNHLRELATKEQVTVIVTTHYMTEFIHCDKIGFMRNGKIIVEDSPNNLLELDGSSSNFEDVLMKLCKKDEDEIRFEGDFEAQEINLKRNFKNDSSNFRKRYSNEIEIWNEDNEVTESRQSLSSIIFALGYKNLLIFRRDWMLLVLLLIIGPMNLIMEETVVRAEPKGLTLSYVIGNDSKLVGNFCEKIFNKPKCFGDDRSPICNLLTRIKSRRINIIQFQTEMEAEAAVQNGDAMGYIRFDKQYTQYLKKRLLFRNFVNNETVLGSEVKVRLDMAPVINSIWLRAVMLEEYINSMKDLVKGCGQDEKLVELPLKFKSLYSDVNAMDDYSTFLGPGMVLMVIYIMGNFTGAIYVREKRLGLQNRGLVVGVKFSHQVLSSLITDTLIITYQIVVLFTIQSQIYGVPFKGSLSLCFLIAYLFFLSGQFFGIAASIFVEDEVQMFFILVLMNNCQIFASGAFWPIECIPWPLRFVCYGFPMTFPVNALRAVMFYGWGLNNYRVLAGLGSSLIWIIVLVFLIMIARKKY